MAGSVAAIPTLLPLHPHLILFLHFPDRHKTRSHSLYAHTHITYPFAVEFEALP